MMFNTTFGGFTPYFGGQNYLPFSNWGYNSTLPLGGSTFGFGFPTVTSSSACDSYESERRKDEAEFQKNKREYEARKAQEEQAKLLEEMKKESSDIFPELNAEEEKILLAYLEKVNKSYNKQVVQDGIETGVGIAGTATVLGTLSWVGEHTGATAVLSKGVTCVGNGIAQATPTWMTNTVTSIGNGASWVAQNTGASTLNAAMNSAGYGRVANAAADMSARAASATGTISKAATSIGAKTANFCNGALSKVAKLGPVVEAGKVVYEDWGDLKTAYKAGGKSAVKQTAQTTVKAGASAAGFWVGCKGGAALGATIGSCLGPIGTAVGGFLGGLIGGIAGAWGAKKVAQKCVGEDEGERLKRMEMEKAAAEKQVQIETYQNEMIAEALTYAQSDAEMDEATAAVLAKLQGRFALPPEAQAQPPEAQAQSQAQAA